MLRPVTIGEQVLNRRGASTQKANIWLSFFIWCQHHMRRIFYNESGYIEVERLADYLYRLRGSNIRVVDDDVR